MVNKPLSRFTLLVKKRRQELELTQTAIARGIGIDSPEFIGLVERGDRRISLEKVPLLADALKIEQHGMVALWLFENNPAVYRALFSNKDPELPAVTNSLVSLISREMTFRDTWRVLSEPEQSALLVIADLFKEGRLRNGPSITTESAQVFMGVGDREIDS